MVSSENELVAGFVLVAFSLFLLLPRYAGLADEWVIGIVFLVGILVPQLLLEYTDLGSEPTPTES